VFASAVQGDADTCNKIMYNVHFVNFFGRVCFYVFVEILLQRSHSLEFCLSTW